MDISLNVQPLLKGKMTGIGFYCYHVASEMIALDQENRYHLDYFTAGAHGDNNPYIGALTDKQNVTVHANSHIPESLYKLAALFAPIPYRWFFKEKSEISVFFNFIVPPFVRGKKIVFVYDVCFKACPETVRFKTKFLLNLGLKNSCKRADRIIAISESTKREILRYLDIKEEKIRVVQTGADLGLHFPRDKDEIEPIKSKYAIYGDYYFYLGTIEPRKNIIGLLEAYAKLRKKREDVPPLIIGGQNGWLYQGIYQKFEELRLKDFVKFIGYVPDEDAPFLISGAISFVFPSLYEGFGMPPLEAMACGTPVIVSNSTSLPEVVGDAGILVDPYNTDELCEAMLAVYEDAALRAALSQKGLERAKGFQWTETARQLLAVVCDLANQ